MRIFPSPSQPAFRFLQNLLTICGLWFLYGFIGSPLTFLFGRAFIEGVIFSGFAGHIALRALGSLPSFLVAAFLGAAIPHFIVSDRQKSWALGFAFYLGLFHCLSWISPSRIMPVDNFTELAIALLLGSGAFLGFVRGARAMTTPSATAQTGA